MAAAFEELSDTEIRAQLALGAFSTDQLWELMTALQKSPRHDTPIYNEVEEAYIMTILKVRDIKSEVISDTMRYLKRDQNQD